MFIGILLITMGLNCLLLGLKIIKVDWKSEVIEKKQERRLNVLGVIFVSIGLIRVLFSLLR